MNGEKMKKPLLAMIATLASATSLAGECDFSMTTFRTHYMPKKVKLALKKMGYQETIPDESLRLYWSKAQRDAHTKQLRNSLAVTGLVVNGKGKIVRITRNRAVVATIENYNKKSTQEIQNELSSTLRTCP